MSPPRSRSAMNPGVQPREARLRFFMYLERMARLPIIRSIVAVVKYLFVDLAPNLPRTRIFSLTSRGRWQIFWSAYVVTFLLCLVATCVWSMLVGTFSGDDPSIRYYSDDWQNIVLYAFVCPTYVGLGAVLIASVTGGYWELRRLEEEIAGTEIELTRLGWRVPALVLFILVVALVLTSLYIADVSDVDRVDYVYWFLEGVGGDEVRLSSLGVYYFLLNFSLLLVTLVSLAFFMSSFAATLRVASALTAPRAEGHGPLTLETMKTRLQTFVGAYLAAKLLVGVYVINFWIWEESPLGNTGNLLIAHVFLALVGVLFLAIPRNYIELQWQRYKVASGLEEPEDLQIDHLVDRRASLWALAIDQLLIGSIFYVPFLSY
jgi:hypothetical protein